MRCAPIPAMTIVLVTPAFPETGRTVYQGNLFVGSVPLNESPLKDHPLNPMHDSNLVRVLARQSKTKVGLVDLADHRARAGRRPRASCRSCRQGCWRCHRRCGVRPRSRNHRRGGAGSSRSRSAPPASGSGLPARWSPRGQVKSNAPDAISERAGRRTGGVPCRQLFAGDAAADRQRRAGHAGAASRSRPGRRGQGGSPARAGLGQRTAQAKARS